MHPLHNFDHQEEEYGHVPAPLFAGQERPLNRQLSRTAVKAFTMILEVMDEIYVFLAEFLQDAKTICFGEPVRSPTSPQREPPSRNSSVQCMDMWDFFHMDFIPGDEGYEYIVDVEQGIRAGGRSSDADSNESAYPRPNYFSVYSAADVAADQSEDSSQLLAREVMSVWVFGVHGCGRKVTNIQRSEADIV
ncbi:hypothetical protein MMC24_007559 [Lignoscripta atroalba]|nr:hypothetical protein [Lignoscripta atroalba]